MRRRGFTLIELLVVIAIIGLLSSVVLASLNAARSKARDAYRRSSLQQLSVALELYYDTNGRYPLSTSCRADAWCVDNQATTWIPGLTSTYISNQPHDVTPSGIAGLVPFHYFSSDGTHFVLVTSMENAAGTCAGGKVFYWPWDGVSNMCGWWGGYLYVVGR